MEKTIKKVIDSFVEDFDQRKLDFLDRLLFYLLLKREFDLLYGKRNSQTDKRGYILNGYFDYRNLVFKRLMKSGRKNKEFLIRRIYSPVQRLVFLITHNCQLRCRYCRVRKFPASMNEEVLFKAIDLLFTSNSQEIQVQFFGGEPLLRFDLIKKAVNRALKINKRLKRDIIFILTTNGIELTKERVDFLKRYNFFIEYSIDGEVESQLKTRKACGGKPYYSQMIHNFEYLKQTRIPHYSISVVMPQTVLSMFDNFKHLVNLGFRRLQTNYSLGVFWPERRVKDLLRQTEKIINYVNSRDNIEFINLTSLRREPVVLNAELTVDCDGGIYLESGICLEEDFSAMKSKFLVATLKNAKNIDFYNSTVFQNFYRLSAVYADVNPRFRKIILNNIVLGKRYDRFVRNENGQKHPE